MASRGRCRPSRPGASLTQGRRCRHREGLGDSRLELAGNRKEAVGEAAPAPPAPSACTSSATAH